MLRGRRGRRRPLDAATDDAEDALAPPHLQPQCHQRLTSSHLKDTTMPGLHASPARGFSERVGQHMCPAAHLLLGQLQLRLDSRQFLSGFFSLLQSTKLSSKYQAIAKALVRKSRMQWRLHCAQV